MNINNITMSGNLTRDAELRTTKGGKHVLLYGIAVNDRQQVNGEWQDVPYFLNCVQFGNVDNLVNVMKKGMKVVVNGKLQIQEYEKDGIKRNSPQIVVFALDLASGNKNESPNSNNGANTYADDIPF